MVANQAARHPASCPAFKHDSFRAWRNWFARLDAVSAWQIASYGLTLPGTESPSGSDRGLPGPVPEIDRCPTQN